MLRTKLALGVLALSAGVYSTYYVIKDEQISEEDVVVVAEEIKDQIVLEKTQETSLLTSSTSETSSGSDAINSEPSNGIDHSVTNDFVASTSDATDLKNASDDQTDSALPKAKEPKNDVSEIAREPNAVPPETSSDLNSISEGERSGKSESSEFLSCPTEKEKEKEVKSETSSDSSNTEPQAVRSESNSLNIESAPVTNSRELIDSQSAHSDEDVVLKKRVSKTQDLRVEQVQDFEIKVIGANEVDFDEEADIGEALSQIDLGTLSSWGSSDASFRQDLSIEEDNSEAANKGSSNSELQKEDDEESLFTWIGSILGY